KGFREGLQDAIPTAPGYISIGIAFGVVASSAGLSALEVGLMSLLIYGGSAQFAMVAMIVSGADLLTITLTVFLVNLRNMLMTLHATTIFTKTPFLQNILMAT
ncbi:AzlC family ABC transporter permease, partial [Larkinella sp. C7]|uniref:AzlC family ABC transporter permease n=1 Tax=Larkinella sp. C7 TaxID=2576607 RepID=UPI001485C3FF